ncbi:ATP-dependent Clp protease ATP-binding protein [Planctomycetales bacterium]|nr:ATP-dependent Clp protease ATP-binding protein [Planctomycetales bacterium]
MFERFTDRAKKVVNLARQEAERLGAEFIGTEHILLGIVKEGSGVAANVLEILNVDLERVRLEVEKFTTESGEVITHSESLPFTPKAKHALELAAEEARALQHNYIGTEHLLLGLLREHDGIAAQVFINLNVEIDQVRAELLELLGANDGEDAEIIPGLKEAQKLTKKKKGKASETPALDSFGRDLTAQAKEGLLDPVIGREKEIMRLLQVLSRRTKNNPVLIGEAGVGKTAIVEGLAQKITANQVPDALIGKRVVSLDLAMMVAGTKYRGQFEERIKMVMNEIKKAKNVILFIDEIHTLIGAGGAEGTLDAANVIKPALARGEMQCVGATTLDEYRKYMEKDSALERRFQPVIVNPPSQEEAIQILQGLRDRYEAHHRVRITDDAIAEAVKLSERYISGRFLPDKAVDVIDEAGAKVRLSTCTRPPDLSALESELAGLEREKLEAVATQAFERAAELRDSIDRLLTRKEQLQGEWRNLSAKTEGVVDAEVVTQVISTMTGVPLTRVEQKETVRLLNMETELHEKVISQDEAIAAVSRCLRRSRAGMRNPRRPLGSFLFLGPTGVGKTLLARALAEFMFGDADSLIRVDMSEYMEKHSVSRLIGAPPGYVGFEEGGQLTEKVRRRPYAVVLIDEIEKAHPDIFNILLQVMEDGQLTDSYGRKVNFRNTILIMTSNVGADLIKRQGNLGFAKRDAANLYDRLKKLMLDEVENHFRPEFVNRLDAQVVFRYLDKADLERIVLIELDGVHKRMVEMGMGLELTPAAMDFLIEKGYSQDFGARPLRRTVEQMVEDPIAEDILRGKFLPGHKIVVELSAGVLIYREEPLEVKVESGELKVES